MPTGTRKSEADTLYCIVSDDLVFKIGISNDVTKRLRSIQSSYPFDLKIAWTINCRHRARSVEDRVHKHLRRAGLHLRGEWFLSSEHEVSPEACWAAVKRLAEMILKRPEMHLPWDRRMALRRQGRLPEYLGFSGQKVGGVR